MAGSEIYLGSGPTYPLKMVGGKAGISTGKNLLRQDITRALDRVFGSRFFIGEFGFRGEELMFEQNDDVFEGLMEHFIAEVIQQWVTRVKYIRSEFEHELDDEGRTDIKITVQILQSNEIDSFIYPFYRELIY